MNRARGTNSLLVLLAVLICAGPGLTTTVQTLNNIRFADQYVWTQTGSVALVAGANTITLSPCPLGVNGTDTVTNNTPHSLYITAGTGDPNPSEPVLITGGTCNGGASLGTISFLAAFSHCVSGGGGCTSSWRIGSATGGGQEAERDTPNPDSKIIFSPHQVFTFNAPLFLSQNNVTIEGEGAKIDCKFNDSCIVMGQRTAFGSGNAGTWAFQTVRGLRMRPAVAQWTVSPTGSIAGGSPSVTVTVPTCPSGFYAAIPSQVLWLNGASSGVGRTIYGTGEFVQVTGGNCTPGRVNGTITVTQVTPGITNLSSHDAGFTLGNGVAPAIEDNAQGSLLEDIKGVANTGAERYGFLIQIDNDQAAKISHPNLATSNATRGDADFAGGLLFGPGPNSMNAGIAYVEGGESSGPSVCVDWWNGNDISIHDFVCQAFSLFGMRMGRYRGGLGLFTIGPNVHFETGLVSNPLGNVGIPAIINAGVLYGSGAGANFGSNGSGAQVPLFLSLGSQTATQYYYIVHRANNLGCTGDCKSTAMPGGLAVVADPSLNNVPLTFVAPPGATSFDILRVSSNSGTAFVNPPPAPTGTGNYAVATGVTPASICNTKSVCTFTDNVASPQSYTVTTLGTGSSLWTPKLLFWPGGVVVASSSDTGTGLGTYIGTSSCVVNERFAGNSWNVLFTDRYAPPGNGCMAQLSAPTIPDYAMGNAYAGGATLMPSKALFDGGLFTGIKGRVNFLGWGSGPFSEITLFDSNYLKTLSSTNILGNSGNGGYLRPTWDAGDADIGVDGANGRIHLRSPESLSFYINQIPTGSNWLEQLTATQKTLKVPLSVNNTDALSSFKFHSTQTINPAAVAAQRCSDQTFSVSGLQTSDRVSNVLPPQALGNLSLNAYVSAANTILFHFCNPSTASAQPPPGQYSFLAVH